jgi:dUTP pyrophosphatase
MGIKYIKVDQNAPDFVQPNEGDAGYDLRSNEDVILKPFVWNVVGTGIAITIPKGYVGLVRGRSGLAFKDTVFPFHGTIDSVYRGEWRLLVRLDPSASYDCMDLSHHIKRGDKIAQVVFVQYLSEPTELVDRLDETERGKKGFGSTGV